MKRWLCILAFTAGIVSMGAEEESAPMEYWSYSQETSVGDRAYSQSITIWRKDGKFDGFSGHKCSIAGAKETESPLRKIEFNAQTRQLRFHIVWSPPDDEADAGNESAPDAVFDGVLEDNKIRGTLTYTTTSDCIRNFGPEITLNKTMGASDGAPVAKPTAPRSNRHEIRLSSVSTMNEINGGRVAIGGKGWAFLYGRTQNFKSAANPTLVDLTISEKAAPNIRKCQATLNGEIPKGEAIQIVGRGSFESRPTKNPDLPTGIFVLDRVERCQLVKAKAAAAK